MVDSNCFNSKVALLLLCSLIATLASIVPQPPHPIDCVNGEITPISDDKTKFNVCDHGTLVEVECPEGLIFNSELSVCDFPFNVEEPQCEDGAVQVDEHNPSIYYVCSWGTLIEMTCPANLVYNKELDLCDYRENIN